MKNFKTLSLLTLLSLVFAFVFAFIPTNSVKASQSDFDCEYSACAQNEISVNVPHYGCSSVTTYTFDQAVSANIPEGFTDSVIAVENSSATSKGVVLDFTSKNIPVSIVKSISVRVYVYDDGVAGNNYPELRIPLPGSVGSWTIRYVIGDNTGKWVDFEIVEGEGEGYKCNFDNLSTDGKLGAFELAVRNNNTRDPFYIDYIKVNLYEDDGKAPVLTYDGKDEVVIPYGRPLNFAVSAHDEIEGEIAVEYVWGDESLLDENGLPQKGNHTLTFKATDYFGNTSTKTISVTVEDPDDEAPVINCNLPSIIYVKEGVIPQFSFTATDNREGEIVATVTWSNGALNGKGQLVKGWHHFIVKATDGSGNESSIRINVIVNETGEECDNVIDESILFPRDPDEEESESESESESVSESESESESESVKESVSEPESESESESVKESESESVSASESQSESLPQEEGCGGCGGCGANSSEETEGGCGGLINASALLTILLVAGAFIIRKKSND